MVEILRHVVRYFYGRLEAEGALSTSQYFVLKLLGEHGSQTVTDLAGRLDMTTAGATGLVDRLVKAGLAGRRRDESDRRVVWVDLTADGARTLAEARNLRRSVMAELCNSLTETEVDQMVALLEKVFDRIPAPAPAHCRQPNAEE
jgi:DNA-binding MarR family transcriptional regulator